MIEKARLDDPPELQELIRHYAGKELMLPRSLMSLYEHLRDFHVWREDGTVLGCAALHLTWRGLAEVRSLAVAEQAMGRGIGTALVESCLEEARRLAVPRVFVLTYVPEFFQRFGFEVCDKGELPHKVWADCINCPHFPDCDEVAMTMDLLP
jgi:amino-acid N-acetyltransferase